MIKALLSIRLRSVFSAFLGKPKNGKPAKLSAGKIVLVSILMVYLALVFLGLFTMYAIALGSVFIPAGNGAMYFGMFMIISFSVVFVLSVFQTKSELFDCKDNELLLSMPIDTHSIVISRISSTLLLNYSETSLVMLPVIVVYAVMSGDPVGTIGGILVFLLLPLLSTAISSAFGYLVARISKRIKYKTLITTLVSIAFLLLYFVFYFRMMDSLGMEESEEMLMIPEIPFATFIGRVAMLEPLFIAVFAILAVGTAFIAYRIITGNYISIISNRTGAARTEYKRERLERRSALYALTVKELRRFFSSTVYMLNSGMGIIFTLVLAGATVFKYSELGYALNELSLSADAAFPVIILGLCACASFNMTSTSAVSLEGKSFWIPKSMPVSARQILLSKLLCHFIVTEVPSLIASVAIIVATGAYGVELPFIILLPALSNLLFGILGLILNTAFPKLNYENEAQPVKQSLPVFLIMMLSMLWDVILAAIALGSVFMDMITVGYTVALLAHLALCLGFGTVLLGPSCRKFNKIQ